MDQARFGNSRFFHSSEGWHAILRPTDATTLAMLQVAYRVIPGEGLVVGPLADRRRLERWFDGFIATYGRHRHNPGELPEFRLPKYRPCPRDHAAPRAADGVVQA
ncbi:MAG TPA: hypothetical protein VIX81_02760 [Gammaproteobacteria bacterium]